MQQDTRSAEGQPQHWAQQELGAAQLGDARLSKRLVKLASRLADSPGASINQACRGWAEQQGAYRLLEHEEVDWRAIMQPHWQASEQRMADHPVVLCLQDTTELDFEGRQIEGLGPLNWEAQRGMYLHPTYAVTPDRLPLGVLDAWMWARQPKGQDGQRAGVRESERWIEGYERVAELAQRLPQSQLVYVADREGDMAALMRRAQQLGNPAHWLIRSSHDRNLGQSRLMETLRQQPELGQVQFELSARQGVAARSVSQSVRVLNTELPDGQGGLIACSVIWACEDDPPEGCKAVQWRLLTNRSVSTLEQAAQLIDWYRARWEIELLFHTLKNGCRLERLQLRSIERLERAIALYLVVAWRIGWLMRLGRACGQQPAQLAFSQQECQLAYALNGKKPPAQPTVQGVLRHIAMLGGFIGRKGDGEPGVKSIWLGMQVLCTSLRAVQLMGSTDSG